jgi:hypothetical protein
MLNRYLGIFFFVACAAVTLTSCGSKAGGSAEFATVFATANTTSSVLDSDIALWFDAATGTVKSTPCAATSAPFVAPDDVNYNITSTAYAVPSTGSTNTTAPSDLVITNITLTLTPANSLTPALPARFQTQSISAGQRVVVGNNSIPIRIATDEMKSFLQNDLLCTGLTYIYRASVSFEALEVSTNRVGTITPPGSMLVTFTDFTDK